MSLSPDSAMSSWRGGGLKKGGRVLWGGSGVLGVSYLSRPLPSPTALLSRRIEGERRARGVRCQTPYLPGATNT
jgi:hypothetical protein